MMIIMFMAALSLCLSIINLTVYHKPAHKPIPAKVQVSDCTRMENQLNRRFLSPSVKTKGLFEPNNYNYKVMVLGPFNADPSIFWKPKGSKTSENMAKHFTQNMTRNDCCLDVYLLLTNNTLNNA